MADSEPAVYGAPVVRGVVATATQAADRHGVPAALSISALTPLLAFVATRFLPAPKAHEAR